MQDKRVDIVSQEQYDSGPFKFDGNINELIHALEQIKMLAPIEYRANIMFDIDKSYSYGDSVYANFNAWYYRPHTAEELQKIIEDNKWRKERDEVEQKKLYEQLKSKFG